MASAGTGKTKALLGELKALLDRGVPLRRIAALTFTRKAAEELRNRAIRALEGEEARREAYGALFTTVHGFMAEALRHTAPFLALDPDFRLLEPLEAEALFGETARTLLFLQGQGEELWPYLLALYRRYPSVLALRPAEGTEDPRGILPLFHKALEAHRDRLRVLALLGPADLEEEALRLVKNPQALGRLLERFPYLLIDEYQDLNPRQARFFQALEAAGAQVVAVGDPKQSIYLFRNARVEVFREALRGAEEVRLLGRTYRHARGIAAFLNRFVALFPEEGVPVTPVREEEGRVEVHWVEGEDLAQARKAEAYLLAERLLALRAEGFPFSGMAVLVRSRNSIPFLERAFRARGVPFLLRRGLSLFSRPEVRDLYHALRWALREDPLSLLALLQGPFLGQGLGVWEGRLEDLPGEVQARLLWLKGLASRPPLEALAALVRDGALRGLSPRARANLDTLLLQAASRGFATLEALLAWMERGVEDPEALEPPEAGEGVGVYTVHGAKGLEWPVVAVFDLARGRRLEEPPLVLGLGGEVALKGEPAYGRILESLRQAEGEEEERLLYVALSRARDVLLLTGSVKRGAKPKGIWAKTLVRMGLGPGSPDPLVRRHQAGPWPKEAPPPQVEAPPPLPPYAAWQPPKRPWPFVFSPSALRKGEVREGASVAQALGTLVHWAIARDLDPEDQEAMEGLLLQEVAFPLSPGEQRALLEEVRALLRAYRDLLGPKLPPREAREEDWAELPLLLPLGDTVWHGVLDRLYRVGGEWYLDDYKTDRRLDPEPYRFQLALYAKAVEEALGVWPRARLVFLRFREVVAFPREALEEALSAVLEGRVGPEDLEEGRPPEEA